METYLLVIIVCLLVLAVIACVAVTSILLCPTPPSGSNEQITIPEVEEIKALPPYPARTLQKSLVTNNGKVIFHDPTSSVHLKTPMPRVHKTVRWQSRAVVDLHLLKMFRKQKYAYQTDAWSTSLYWTNKKKKVQFSVILPVYNQELVICTNLQSIFNNTHENFEVIVIADGCTDKTEDMIVEWWNLFSPPPNCIQFIMVSLKQSVFETLSDNIGFQLASAPLMLEIQADMKMTQPGYNLLLAQPICAYNDIIGVSGRCTHNDMDCIGQATLTENVSYLNDDKCYLMATVNRGPLLLDASKLIECGYLDEDFALGNDDHDLFYRAWKSFGYRGCYRPIEFECDLKMGTTRKPMDPAQKSILQLRRKKTELKYAQLQLPVFRHLKPISKNPKLICVSFANTESIHWQNAELTVEAHKRLGIEFDQMYLFNEFDVKPMIDQLPPDAFAKRGYNYWSWKPWIIHQTMLHSPPNSLIIYIDAGMFFKNKLLFQQLIDRSQAQVDDYTFYQVSHNNSSHCKCEVWSSIDQDEVKKDASRSRHIKSEDDETEEEEKKDTSNVRQEVFKKLPMVNAALLLFRNTSFMQQIAYEWQQKALEPFMISDVPSGKCTNSTDFIDHRHDQALLSLIVRKHQLNVREETTGSELLCHHHTRSDHEYSNLCKKLKI